MEDKYNFSDFSDSEDDASDFKSTIEAIRKLDNHKQVLPAERSEPSLKVDEYHLTKEGDSSSVKLSELTRVLSKQPKHSKIAHDLKVAQKRTKTLPKPLERPEAERVSRSVGFEKVTKQLSYWDPVVHQNRISEHQVFPLPNPEDSVTTAQDLTASLVPETDLEKRMAEILKKNNPNLEAEEDGSSIFQLTLEEMVEKRKEAARLRAQQSYMLAKARRQNKIKSKTYHRIARRERIRQQMKEFETLQQTNPEEALKRIEEIEKERALERVSLRHRNTGKWAKNQAVRAKYNKESREVLSEQLKLSRDLTKKVAIDSESSGEDDDLVNDQNVESDNPWVGGGSSKTEADVDNFISGYRKFWDAKHDAKELEKAEEEEEAKREIEREVADERAQRLLKSAVVAASASVLQDDDASSDDAQEITTTSNDKLIDKQPKVTSAPVSLNKDKDISRTKSTAVSSNKNTAVTSKKDTAVSPPKDGKKVVSSKKGATVSSNKDIASAANGTATKPKEKTIKPQKGPVKTQRERLKSDSAANKRKAAEAEVSSKKKRLATAEERSSDPEKRNTALRNIPNGTSEVVSKKAVNGKPEKAEFVNSKSGKWTVTVKEETKPAKKNADLKQKKRELNSMFSKMNNKLQELVDEKMGKLKKSFGEGESNKKKRKTRSERKAATAANADLQVGSSLRGNRYQRPDEDEALDEQSGNQKLNIPSEKECQVADFAAEVNGKVDALPEIDPNNFLKTVSTRLENAVPDLLANGDEGMDDDDPQEANQLTISEAFADDDVVAEFEREKDEEIDRSKPKDLDLTLPGWGSWGGHQIKPNERKRKRFILKAPETAKRRDENKGNLYINEKVENKLKPQQVNELPFPFKSVKDYEASIGAPIGNTFIPESAHRKLILPKVLTKTGTIIKPLSKDILIQRKKEKERMKTAPGKKVVKS